MPQMQDDENETLDWGNEEEESHESPRRAYSAGFQHRILAGDDVEDTISLGDDDDDQRFYSHNVDPSSSQTKSAPDAQPEQQRHGAQVSVQETPQISPTRSLPRLTHALPPKPVAASVTALTTPYTSIIATMTPVSPRTAANMNGNFAKKELSPASADLPQDWETRSSRKGETYYYNRVTHECTWARPASKISLLPSPVQEDAKSRQRSVSPPGNKQSVSFDSNIGHSQNSISTRDSAHNGEPETEEKRRPLTPDSAGLTFEDRHYRPAFNSDLIRGRSDTAGRHPRSPSPRRRMSASSPGSKGGGLHFRAKDVPRDQLPAQEKSAHARTGSSAPKLDSYVPDYDTRRWSPSPPPLSLPDYHGRSQRDRPAYGTSEDDRMQVDSAPEYRSGPPLRREDIAREQGRDQDPQARSSDVREPSASQSYFSAQRSRSPPPLPPSRERDRERDGKREIRERGYHEGLGPPYFNPSSIAAARSERGEREGQHSERERPRQYERSYDPISVQDRGRGQEWPIDAESPRERLLDRDRKREGERSERDRGIRSTRREDADRPSKQQRPLESYDPEPRGSQGGSQGDTKPKRNPENYDRKPEEATAARSKRVPLPPQQTFFRSAKLRDVPPHAISTPSKRQDDNPRVLDDMPPRQPRNSLSVGRVMLPDLNRPPNGADIERFFLDGTDVYELQKPLSYDRGDISHPDKRIAATRDDVSHLPRRQSGQDPQRHLNIPVDSTEKEPRSSVDQKLKDEKPIIREGGSSRDARPQSERTSSRRGRDVPKQPARLTGTNNIPIGSRRGGFQTGPTAQRPESIVSTVAPGTLEAGPLRATRILPPGKESYERPPDLVLSDVPRHSDPSSRIESGKNRPPLDLRHPQTRQDDEARNQRPYPRPPPIIEHHSNGSRKRSLSPPLSRNILLDVPERLPANPSSNASFYTSQNPDPRGSYRQRDDPPRRDVHGVLSRSPKHLPADDADASRSFHPSAGGDPLPPRLRKSLSGGAEADTDPRYSSVADSLVDRDFLSRVEAPPLRRGGSLLDRIDNKDRGLALDSPISSGSLRDRLVPSKRDRAEMSIYEWSSGRDGGGEMLEEVEGNESKRARKRGGKRRSGTRRA